MNIRPSSVIAASAAPGGVVGGREAGGRHDRDRLEDGVPDRRPRSRTIPSATSSTQERPQTPNDQDEEVEPKLVVASHGARLTLHERRERGSSEVDAGDHDEERDRPLDRASRTRRSSCPGWRSRRVETVAERVRDRVEEVHAIVETEPAVRAQESDQDQGQRDVERSRADGRSRGSTPSAARARSARAAPTGAADGRRRGVAGRIATASTMIPIPPSHCVNCRHMRERARELVEVGDDGRAGRGEPRDRLEVRVERVAEHSFGRDQVGQCAEDGRRAATSARRRGSPRAGSRTRDPSPRAGGGRRSRASRRPAIRKGHGDSP